MFTPKTQKRSPKKRIVCIKNGSTSLWSRIQSLEYLMHEVALNSQKVAEQSSWVHAVKGKIPRSLVEMVMQTNLMRGLDGRNPLIFSKVEALCLEEMILLDEDLTHLQLKDLKKARAQVAQARKLNKWTAIQNGRTKRLRHEWHMRGIDLEPQSSKGKCLMLEEMIFVCEGRVLYRWYDDGAIMTSWMVTILLNTHLAWDMTQCLQSELGELVIFSLQYIAMPNMTSPLPFDIYVPNAGHHFRSLVLLKIAAVFYERSETLKATLATDAVIGTMASVHTPGSGYVLLHHVMGETKGVRGIWSSIPVQHNFGSPAWKLMANASRDVPQPMFTSGSRRKQYKAMALQMWSRQPTLKHKKLHKTMAANGGHGNKQISGYAKSHRK
eukprot:Gb_31413 [translate_table: standard]